MWAICFVCAGCGLKCWIIDYVGLALLDFDILVVCVHGTIWFVCYLVYVTSAGLFVSRDLIDFLTLVCC